MNSKIRTEELNELFDAILLLKNEDECNDFFMDLCTVNELQSMAQRFKVAMMLKQKKTYTEIAKETGASTATISRVNRSLLYGGYDLSMDRNKDKKNQE